MVRQETEVGEGVEMTEHTPSELPEELQIYSRCKVKPVEGIERSGIIQLTFFKKMT